MAIADFLIGAIVGPKSHNDLAEGFVGFNSMLNVILKLISVSIIRMSFSDNVLQQSGQ